MAVESVAGKEANLVKYAAAIAILIAALFIPAFGAAGYVQERKGERLLPDTIDGLQLSIELIGDKKKFRRSDSFSIKIRLRNVGEAPITLYKNMGWGWSSSFFLGVSDGSGGWVNSSFLEDALHYPHFPKEDFVTIKPDEMIERERDVALKQYEIREPGSYFLTVWYQSPVPREFAPEGMKVRAVEDGRLESKPVKFEIIK